MRFSHFLTSGLFALSAQAAAIQQENVQEVAEKRATVDLATGVAADILHLIGLSIGVTGNINLKREELEERATVDLATGLAADVLGLIGLSTAVSADVEAKRDDVSVEKRATVDLAVGLALNILQLIGLSVGVSANVSKRDTVNAAAVLDVLHLIEAQLGATAEVDLKKRDGLDVNKLAEDLPSIVAGVLTAVDSIANGTLAELL
ncbi:hypothetical protein Cantr_08558 [Candida viswanathii]|uniref:Cell wall mannoprotein 1 n=1 Tax=Candida viswanathii TaxID=5486 RepID=A0A367Y3F2_9ASCO|nr:hypothetical protein Cantr_08558 [Candida viswanathii]